MASSLPLHAAPSRARGSTSCDPRARRRLVGLAVLPVQTRGIAVHGGPDPLGGGRIRDRKQEAGLAVLQAVDPVGDAVHRRHNSVPQPLEFAIRRNLERHDRNRFGLNPAPLPLAAPGASSGGRIEA